MLRIILNILINKKEDLNDVIRKLPDYKVMLIKNTMQNLYYIGASSVLITNFVYSFILLFKSQKEKELFTMPDWLFYGIWISQILALLVFFLAV